MEKGHYKRNSVDSLKTNGIIKKSNWRTYEDENIELIDTFNPLIRKETFEKKTNHLIITRSNYKFATRLGINNTTLDQGQESKIIGVWITRNLK